jgi:chemotaxis protein methyltransferase CheR
MLTHGQFDTPRRPPGTPAHLPPPAAEAGTIPFSTSDFERVCKLIYQRAGIHLHAGKQSMVYNRLVRRLRACAIGNFADYLAQLDNPVSGEWEHFTNALTTNLTSFFREAHHFPILAEHLRKITAGRPLNIWCTAASTGEEPYTIAITALETLGRNAASVRVIASDIDTTVLQTAEAGEYPEQALDNMSADLTKKYFLRGSGSRAGFVKVRPEVRQLVSFRQVNLLAPSWPRFDAFDAVFCRNVMIYFDKPTQARIIERFAPQMHPGALLFTGHSEHIPPGGQFTLRGKTVYERVAR